MKNNQYLTETCKVCDGIGEADSKLPNSISGTSKSRCTHCKGTGRLPNQDGMDILNLVKVFGKKI